MELTQDSVQWQTSNGSVVPSGSITRESVT
jgi:hypothetical protein